ncbi:MAG TPA: DUF6152 family protein [Steroidobacteraceae bacterium]|nr:DUF6152 family protein [Steroidobacteraceae bacterium]
MRLRPLLLIGMLALTLRAPVALAHHSFAVFFQTDKIVAVTGVVTDFQFSNPHGMIRVMVTNKDGTTEIWTAETNSPSILVPRGWSKESLKIGETVTLQGWPAKTGARYLRMQKVTRANGEVVGKPFDPNAD